MSSYYDVVAMLKQDCCVPGTVVVCGIMTLSSVARYASWHHLNGYAMPVEEHVKGAVERCIMQLRCAGSKGRFSYLLTCTYFHNFGLSECRRSAPRERLCLGQHCGQASAQP